MENQDKTSNYSPIEFTSFRQYCQAIVPILNNQEIVQKQNKLDCQKKQSISYKASYKVVNSQFAIQHDGQYLEIQHLYKTNNQGTNQSIQVLLKINITYSIAYQIPLLLFMPYRIITFQNSNCIEQDAKLYTKELTQFKKQQICHILSLGIGSQKILPEQDQTGVFVVKNHINKQYYYSLHHCYMANQGMDLKQLIPYYLALLGCHPQISL